MERQAVPLAAQEFDAIQRRNATRRELRSEVTPGRWVYDSFAFVVANEDPDPRRTCIVVRTREWFDNLLKLYGPDVLDRGTTDGPHQRAIQPAVDATYIAAVCSDDVEGDIDALIREIHRLRGVARQ